jgi:hypothetical protein
MKDNTCLQIPTAAIFEKWSPGTNDKTTVCLLKQTIRGNIGFKHKITPFENAEERQAGASIGSKFCTITRCSASFLSFNARS